MQENAPQGVTAFEKWFRTHTEHLFMGTACFWWVVVIGALAALYLSKNTYGVSAVLFLGVALAIASVPAFVFHCAGIWCEMQAYQRETAGKK